MGKAVFVASGKGGVGKTSFTAGVASCLAAMRFRTLCIDADVGLRNLDIPLGMNDITALDLGDVLRRDAALGDAAAEHPDIPGLYLLAAPPSMDSEELRLLPALISYAASAYDFCLVDGPAGLGPVVQSCSKVTGTGIIVTTPDRTSLRDAEAAARLFERVGGRHLELRLALNRARPSLMASGGAPNADDAMDTVGIPLIGVVPEDERVIACSNRGEALVLTTSDGAAAAYLRIAKRLVGESVPIAKEFLR